MIPPARRPRVFTIPASVDFLPTLARALIDGRIIDGFAPKDPFELARTTIYLPTRRACRLAHEAFLDALDANAAILPRIVPIGDIDEDEFIFADESVSATALDLPTTIRPTRPPRAARATHPEMVGVARDPRRRKRAAGSAIPRRRAGARRRSRTPDG